MPFRLLRVLFLFGPVVAQDLFEKESRFLAKHGLTMETVNPSESNLTAQVAVASTNTWYKTFTPKWNTKLCLDLPGGNPYPGNMLWLWECNGQDSQIWVFDSWQIRYGANEDFCVDARDMSDGTQLMLWNCNGQPQQTWGYDDDHSKLYISNSAACFDLWENQQVNGQFAHVWTSNEQWQQEWSYWDSAAPSNPSPSPSPGPSGSDCDAGQWPKFKDYNQLKGDNWGRYFEAVYGAVPDSGYPICLADFWVLYDKEVTKAGAHLPVSYSECPPDDSANSKGAYYSRSEGQGLWPVNTKAIFHPPELFVALPDNTWIEVAHRKYPAGGESNGAWFYWAKGAGIWYNIGKTKAFQDHGDAFKHYNVQGSGGSADKNEEMSRNCVSAGDDSIQFLNHKDGGTCGSCCHVKNTISWTIEVVACKMVGDYACAAKQGDKTLKAGWMGNRNCDCDENGLIDSGSNVLNCKNVPYR